MPRRLLSVVLVVLVCVAAWAVLAFFCRWKLPADRAGFVEDTYISFRYARNLAEGHGLVWNVGEKPVEGFTNLMWVLMLAGARSAGLCSGTGPETEPEMAVAPVLGLGHSFVTIVAFTVTMLLLVRPRYRWLALCVPFHFALNPYVMWHTVSGMETAQVMCFVAVLMMLTVIFFVRPRAVTIFLVSAWGAVGCVIRPDMVLPVGVLLLALVFIGFRERRFGLVRGFSLAFVMPVLVGLGLVGWKLRYFGTVLSPPLIIKGSILHNLLHPVPFSFIYVGTFLLWATPYLVLMALGAVSCRESTRLKAATTWVVAGGVYLGYFLTVVPMMGFAYRFLMPFWGVMVVLGLVGLGEVLHVLSEAVGTSRPRAVRVLTAAAVVMLTAYPMCLAHELWSSARHSHVAYDELREIGKVLGRLHSPHELCLATNEAGNLPYFSRWKTVDMLGLNDPEIARHFNTADLPAELVMRHRPDVIFMRDRESALYIAEALRAHPDFSHYRAVGRWRTGDEDIGPILVNMQSPRLDEFLPFFEFRQTYLSRHPHEALPGRAHRYVQTYLKEGRPADP